MKNLESSIEGNDSFSSAIEEAVNYTGWITGTFRPFVGKALLEVGLGAGNYLDFLPPVDEYKGLDYDENLIEALRVKYPGRDYHIADLSQDTFLEISGGCRFDTVLCCNVIEHIEDDAAAVDRLMSVLKPGGRLLLFVPAFQQLYTEMDRLAGHYRRYTKKTLSQTWQGQPVDVKKLEYFNSIGGIGWWAQKASKVEELEDPGLQRKILFFDRYVLPFSRMANPLTKYFFGQSVLAVLEKK